MAAVESAEGPQRRSLPATSVTAKQPAIIRGQICRRHVRLRELAESSRELLPGLSRENANADPGRCKHPRKYVACTHRTSRRPRVRDKRFETPPESPTSVRSSRTICVVAATSRATRYGVSRGARGCARPSRPCPRAPLVSVRARRSPFSSKPLHTTQRRTENLTIFWGVTTGLLTLGSESQAVSLSKKNMSRFWARLRDRRLKALSMRALCGWPVHPRSRPHRRGATAKRDLPDATWTGGFSTVDNCTGPLWPVCV